MPPVFLVSQPPVRYPVSPYRVHPRIEHFFQQFVNEPFEKHERTEAWIREIANQDWPYWTVDILERGRASFLEEKNGLTPADQVTIYCYFYCAI
jgi:hypothetical protein